MEYVKRVLTRLEPYHGKMLVIGAAAIALQLAIAFIKQQRKTNHYLHNLKKLSWSGLTRGLKNPWAMLVFHDGDKSLLKEIVDRITDSGINVYLVAQKRYQELVDHLHQDCLKKGVKFRYTFDPFDNYASADEYETLEAELREESFVAYVSFTDNFKFSFRNYEEHLQKEMELDKTLRMKFVTPLSFLSFVKGQRSKEHKKLILLIDGMVDEQVDKAGDILFLGMTTELVKYGFEYKRLLSAQGFQLL
jgi:hypothetical protein